ncbi:hypothetical protein BATDEDRAFT_23519 [Batrachochytrium dendrobatidis JAM81]|uniref:Uncharacterized protein n=1 Tax=Batrachochytrium dendrobatidis (strain JAM81 / FGSC 10211) TaxID=684364 RepID=F4NZ97_BATDJ|nr:uncharacterized protein BATDEDRAFT_23519 [Batrachochytrium dendrobatidis JAM81]EGF81852.1 hypothetical protein BATDEDRAFT_23519 [Batrachochytrium dendrobatidis JAM81]|eukprot:XP_006677303.1 hypothetical protein BATDEDRAFT_23519 [Batrachochytrium dendrobatidis JAM81]
MNITSKHWVIDIKTTVASLGCAIFIFELERERIRVFRNKMVDNIRPDDCTMYGYQIRLSELVATNSTRCDSLPSQTFETCRDSKATNKLPIFSLLSVHGITVVANVDKFQRAQWLLIALHIQLRRRSCDLQLLLYRGLPGADTIKASSSISKVSKSVLLNGHAGATMVYPPAI